MSLHVHWLSAIGIPWLGWIIMMQWYILCYYKTAPFLMTGVYIYICVEKTSEEKGSLFDGSARKIGNRCIRGRKRIPFWMSPQTNVSNCARTVDITHWTGTQQQRPFVDGFLYKRFVHVFRHQARKPRKPRNRFSMARKLEAWPWRPALACSPQRTFSPACTGDKNFPQPVRRLTQTLEMTPPGKSPWIRNTLSWWRTSVALSPSWATSTGRRPLRNSWPTLGLGYHRTIRQSSRLCCFKSVTLWKWMVLAGGFWNKSLDSPCHASCREV